MPNVPATIDPKRPSWMAKYVPDVAKANAEYMVPTGTPFGVVTIEGKIWAGKIGKEPPIILRDEQNFPVPYFDAVIVAASPVTTKTFYLTGYPGKDTVSNAPPDCASDDGVYPNVGVPKPQSESCASCEHNKFRPNGPPGQKGKRCQDNKRIAVLPDADDWQNEHFNGPMLLRLAPSSRTMFGEYAMEQSSLGRVLHGIVTRMSFDTDQSGIVIKFQFLRYLDETDMPEIMQWRNEEHTARVLGIEHPPEWKPSVTQAGEGGEAAATQTAPKPKLNGGAAAKPNGHTPLNGEDLAEAVEAAEEAITTLPIAGKTFTKRMEVEIPIEPVKEAAPPKLTADEKKAARIAEIRAKMEAELLAAAAEEGDDELAPHAYAEVDGEPIDDTKSVMDMLDNFAAQE